MSMQLNKRSVEKLRDSIKKNPLDKDEIRRIVGAGQMYVALSANSLKEDEYIELFVLSFNEVHHTFYKKIPKSSSAEMSA